MIDFFVFILGACIGSFLNVCIYRLPKEKSIVRPRSFCPKCRRLIRWYDNIPLISYIIIKGRCRRCGKKISLVYPLVELLIALSFLTLYLRFGLSLDFLAYTFLFCILIVVSFIDIKYHAIPVSLCILGIASGLIFKLILSMSFLRGGVYDLNALPIWGAVKGLIFGLGFTYLFKLFGDVFIDFYLRLRKKESIEGERECLGLGDVDFMGMVGVFLGIKGAVLVFFIAPFLAILYSIYAFIFKKSHLIPYLPYLSAATVIAFFWQDKILNIFF
ncbi:MAG: prepilin peptidase [Candidatus Omnitrophota bacterium]